VSYEEEEDTCDKSYHMYPPLLLTNVADPYTPVLLILIIKS
jgi:hypothetical protein